MPTIRDPFPCRQTRRSVLADCGLGFTGLAMGAMLHRDGIVRANDDTAKSAIDGRPQKQPKAKSVIWLFMGGGVSHVLAEATSCRDPGLALSWLPDSKSVVHALLCSP